jgi:hypothetical protein
MTPKSRNYRNLSDRARHSELTNNQSGNMDSDVNKSAENDLN